MPIDGLIDSLDPSARVVCLAWLPACRSLIDERGHGSVRITETLRSQKRQVELWQSGASSVRLGWHNVGLAWDFAIIDNGVQLADGNDWRYTLCGLVAKALGCKWPTYLRSGAKDAGHIEYRPGWNSLEDYLSEHPPVET